MVMAAVMICLLNFVGCDWGKKPEPEFPKGTIWLGHPDISGWKKTATLNFRRAGTAYFFDYDKRTVWPGRGKSGADGKDVNANAWIIVEAVPGSGQFYAVTFEWLKPGGCLPKKLNAMPLGTYIKRSPTFPSNWHPKPGQRYGVMVSGLARFPGDRTVLERSNVVWEQW